MLPSEVRAKVLSAARQVPSPTRSSLRIRTSILLFSAVALSLGIFFAYGGIRPTARPPHLIAETALGALSVASVVGFFALGRGRSMLGRSEKWLLWASLLTPLALLALKVGISARYPDMMRIWPHRVGFRCLRLSFLMGVFPLAALMVVRRNSDPVHPRLTGAAMGTAVGAGSWLLVDLWCPVAYVPHLLLGHVLPLVMAIVVGAVVGGRVVALRAR
jgi:hypothetical protein